MRRILLTLGTLAVAGCSTTRSGADSSAAAPDSAVATPPATAAPAPVPPAAATPDTAARDTAPHAPQTQVPAGRPAPSDSPSRPRLTPRPPRPVPHRMPPQDASAQPGNQASDQAAIDRLMREAKALAHVTGCTAADQCTVLPLGAKACGGPADYVVYCPRSTDVAALKAKAAELERAQKAFNAKYEIMSTCELRQPPRPSLVGGSCRAAYVGDAPVVPAVPR
ncbi:hypothetical protein J421_4477 [Gemmatirosa kalamazoonensis]|uniref:Lipoprotein n=1 Tax=Gemmatirosa kalamazoonensis TaxID=861299 RepID=W0RLQ0_9BACT|nr:hypothetical protein [Gemmatirosa kalamazoonensis]AHG92014.1 hypothetical protein J421_4477 [Gemmatirosa kalamazoonensis]